MRVKSKKVDLAEGDLTPMIDMTFQLIAFFMVLINFTQTEANDNVVLPNSQLVKPPDARSEFPIILHVGIDGDIFIGGDDYTTETLRVGLRRELTIARAEEIAVDDIDVILRVHRYAPTGKALDIVRIAQEMKLVNFKFRAKEDNR